jgi:tetratricopeptide (TPR) repeat protein
MGGHRKALGAALVLLTFVSYGPALTAGFIWDDDDYVENNSTLRSWDGLRRIWTEPGATPQYYPLVFTTFWLEYQTWGADSDGRPIASCYHIANVVLHGMNAILVWRLLLILGVPAAWWAAAIFAVHPVHAESVAWITERKNVLSGFFYLLAFIAFLRFDSLTGAPIKAGERRWYIVSLALFVAALLCKTVTCSLPAAILLVMWWKKDGIRAQDVLWLLPMFAIGAAFAAITVWMEKHHVGASGVDWNLSFVERCLIAGRAVWFYFGKLIFPVNLAFSYPRWTIDSGDWVSFAYPVSVLAVVAVLWIARRQLGKGPLVSVLLYIGTLLPALGFFDVYPMRFSFVADHFQYLASISLIALVCAAAAISFKIVLSSESIPIALGAAVIAILGVLTWRQSLIYDNLETLWTDTIAKNPSGWLAHYNLGKLYRLQGRLEPAIKHLSLAVANNPSLVEGHDELGGAYTDGGIFGDAMRHFDRARELAPNRILTRLNRGAALAKQGESNEAAREFREILELDPRNAQAWYFLALIQRKSGDDAAAIASLENAVAFASEHAEANHELGDALLRRGEFKKALEPLRRAVQLRGGVPRYRRDLATALEELGELSEAKKERRAAQRLEERER